MFHKDDDVDNGDIVIMRMVIMVMITFSDGRWYWEMSKISKGGMLKRGRLNIKWGIRHLFLL